MSKGELNPTMWGCIANESDAEKQYFLFYLQQWSF
jgi:hypothetical protein